VRGAYSQLSKRPEQDNTGFRRSTPSTQNATHDVFLAPTKNI
jgi:hypothetical protein